MSLRFTPVIGLEVHAQLLTQSKMFCGCSARYFDAPPNSHCCAVCLGMPGALPVINQRAVEFTVLTALALHCQVATDSKFDRKNYSYPDIPKGYQISQYDLPIGLGGWLEYGGPKSRKRCGITRVHLEEDTGKTTHTDVSGEPASLVDYNRSGVPLMEIVTEPDIASPEDAREFFTGLRQVLMFLGVNDGNLQEGSMRADVNVSLRHLDGPPGVKVEIKNLNSFRGVQRALEYEMARQERVLNAGGILQQETRGWVDAQGVTVGQRSKEYAHDYRYFPEPDLPPLVIPHARVEALRETLPEMPIDLSQRFVSEYGLTPMQAAVLTADPSLSRYFEATVRAAESDLPPRIVANWINGDVARILNERHEGPWESQVRPEALAELLVLVEQGTVGGPAAKHVLDQMFAGAGSALDIVEEEGLRQISDESALDRLVNDVLGENAGLVETYRRGKVNVIQALIGKAMAASGGQANPAAVRELMERKLAE